MPLIARSPYLELRTEALKRCIWDEWVIVHPGACFCEYCLWQVKKTRDRLLAAIRNAEGQK